MSLPMLIHKKLKSPHHTLLIRPYLLGQFRIQITDKRIPDPSAPEGHGQIVREMCTYNAATVGRVVYELALAADPEALAETYAKPWNCEAPGGRIRLDNEGRHGE